MDKKGVSWSEAGAEGKRRNMAESNYKDLGQKFKSEIENALSSGDFKGLNDLVSDTVNMAVSDAANKAGQATDNFRQGVKNGQANMQQDATYRNVGPQHEYQPDYYSYVNRRGEVEYRRGKYDYRRPESERRVNKTQEFIKKHPKYRQRTNDEFVSNGQRNKVNQPKPASSSTVVAVRPEDTSIFKKVGNVSGTLCEVFGGIGLGGFGIATVFLALAAVITSDVAAVGAGGIFAGLTLGSAALLGGGIGIKGRVGRAKRYYEIVQKSGYMNVKQIAEAVGKKEKEIVKDLKKLIGNGTFPQGHLDQNEQCFMLTDSTYDEYVSVQKQREILAQNEEKDDKPLTEEEKALKEMIEEGQSYIKQIREKNDAIPGEVISAKLYKMESLLEEIFAKLKKEPKQMPKMQRLMRYYLPTTLKLVSAYEEFDHISVQSDEIIAAKQEIEKTIDTINDAYAELLNKLFLDKAMDVTTDAQVLRTLFAKEGLIEEDMESGE